MLTPTHRLAGLAAAVAVAAHVRPGPVPVVVLLAAATATAGGVLSPDVDQRWHLLDRLLPDELLGHGGPLRHRGLSHFWGLPAAGAVALWLARGALPGWVWWLAAGAVLGWASHLAADFLVGARSEYRRAGIPMGPWFWHVGLGFRCGGLVEDTLGWIVLPAVIAWQGAVLAGWVS